MKNRPFSQRLGFALSGLREGWRREHSFRTQAVCGLLAAAALFVLRPDLLWWAVVALAVATVLAIELVNSALETLIDHLHPDVHPEIRVVKDMLAAAVLMVSCSALIVGALLIVATVMR